MNGEGVTERVGLGGCNPPALFPFTFIIFFFSFNEEKETPNFDF